ncbi:platelet-activating factor acetylhydrolase, isoform II-domain-containing protein [Elsinoe ampelina]|uniref:Putative phospholipase n=1 Tax=Elsinoe ampelina TaxID=302913 RepID=A0A6A6GQP3_9PEZI|nr:platelet-activating factor acetylhydrolase, isoform II-domain-containing protein [Elsinoe ampelina]
MSSLFLQSLSYSSISISQETNMLPLPRLTLTTTLVSLPLLYITYRLLLSRPLLSSSLPSYTGSHRVGTIDLEVPVQPRVIQPAVFTTTGEPAFKLETVLFSVFYPAEREAVGSRRQHYWIPRPISLTAKGWARFAGWSNFVTDTLFTIGLWALVGGTKVPAGVDLPLLRKPDGGKWPVVVFSHGMASMRTSYTQWCGEVASRGYVVVAVEHRDGSAPGTEVAGRAKLHFGEQEVVVDGGEVTREELKRAQLGMREGEVEEVVRVLRRIDEGREVDVGLRGEGKGVKEWKDRLDVGSMTIAGHSYGATLALQTLKNAPSKRMPFKGAIIMDPGKNSGRLNDKIAVPTLIIHSQSWSKKKSVFFGRPHFEVVKELAEKVLKGGSQAWFLTSLETSHPSVCDAPLIEPLLLKWTTGATIDVGEGIFQYVDVSVSFLKYQHKGTASDLLSMPADTTAYGQALTGMRTGKLPYEKYWEIHVSPATSKG